MEAELNPTEIRVLGCLIEKEITTPDYYPLTLNALVNACNQKSNRDPVLTFDETAVLRALDELRIEHRLAVETATAGSRATKYKHCLPDRWDFSPAQIAVLCELFLRGPQTAGDLRARASRMHGFADCREVETVLQELSGRDDGPFVVQLPREPGRRESRWAHLFSGEPAVETEPSTEAAPIDSDRIEALATEIAALRRQLDELRTAFTEFKTGFE
jgi:uncharacterized protein YceH (UPF0502 family)